MCYPGLHKSSEANTAHLSETSGYSDVKVCVKQILMDSVRLWQILHALKPDMGLLAAPLKYMIFPYHVEILGHGKQESDGP